VQSIRRIKRGRSAMQSIRRINRGRSAMQSEESKEEKCNAIN